MFAARRSGVPFRFSTPQSAGDESRRARIASAVLVAALMVAYALPFLVAPIEGDLARDLWFGYRIATGEEWVTIGPWLGRRSHLGPVWYYLLAVPMVLTHSLTGVVLAIAALGATKFLLAWRLGREMVDARFGITWAILLSAAGLSSIESGWIAHPSLVVAASLVVMFALWRSDTRQSGGWLCAACLAFGLALHAHPTTLPLGALVAIVFVRLQRRAGWSVGWRLPLCALLVLLPFAPLAFDAMAQARAMGRFLGRHRRGIASVARDRRSRGARQHPLARTESRCRDVARRCPGHRVGLEGDARPAPCGDPARIGHRARPGRSSPARTRAVRARLSRVLPRHRHRGADGNALLHGVCTAAVDRLRRGARAQRARSLPARSVADRRRPDCWPLSSSPSSP